MLIFLYRQQNYQNHLQGHNILSRFFIMNQTCIICFNRFHDDTDYHQVIYLCKNQHIACSKCADEYSRRSNGNCPLCKLPIKQNLSRYYLYYQCEAELLSIEKQQSNKETALKQCFEESISGLLSLSIGPTQRQYSLMRTKARQMITKRKYRIAVSILMQTAQNFLEISNSECFRGLGSMHQAVCSQSEEHIEYSKEYGQHIALLDELAICLSQGHSYEQALKWYGRMIDKYPRNFKFLFGMGIMEGNHRKFRESLQYLEQAEKLDYFPKICIIKAFVFEKMNKVFPFRKLVLKILESNHSNRSTQFLQLKLETFQKGKQIQKAHKMMEKYPDYIEIILLVASQLGICLALNGNYEAALQYLDYGRIIKSNKQHLLSDLALISQYRRFCFYKLGQFNKACYWFDQKAKQFNNELVEKDNLLQSQLLCLKQLKKYSRIVQNGFQYIDTKLNMRQQELSSIFSIWMHACLQIKHYEYADTVAKKGCNLMKNGFCFEELARIYQAEGKLVDALKYCTLSCQEGYSHYRILKKKAQILEKLELFGQSILAFKQSYSHTKSDQEHQLIDQRLQQLYNKWKPSSQ